MTWGVIGIPFSNDRWLKELSGLCFPHHSRQGDQPLPGLEDSTSRQLSVFHKDRGNCGWPEVGRILQWGEWVGVEGYREQGPHSKQCCHPVDTKSQNLYQNPRHPLLLCNKQGRPFTSCNFDLMAVARTTRKWGKEQRHLQKERERENQVTEVKLLH